MWPKVDKVEGVDFHCNLWTSFVDDANVLQYRNFGNELVYLQAASDMALKQVELEVGSGDVVSTNHAIVNSIHARDTVVLICPFT